MTLTQDDLHALCAIARAAGTAIMEVYQAAIAVIQKDDKSPLTQADLRANAIIMEGLAQRFPGVAVWSEESPKPEAEARTFFLVDPLDGTKEFIRRNGEFTVNIALVHDGLPVAGVVHAPALGDMLYASAGLGAWQVGEGGQPRALHVQPVAADASLRIVGSRSHGSDETGEWIAKLGREHVFVPIGSSLKICRIAQGEADLYPRLGPTSQWDTAAAHAVLAAAGGVVTELDGTDLRYGMERPVLNPFFVAAAQRSLIPAAA